MSAILSRCAALGIVAGGFALTGDLGWLADRGMRVLNARTVPLEEPSVRGHEEAAPPRGDLAPAGPGFGAAPAPAPGDGGPTFRGSDVRPPGGGPERVNLAGFAAGDRLILWIAAAADASTARAWRCLVLDVVDPAAAEALLYEAVSFSATGEPVATTAAPRRVRIAGSGGGAELVRGQSFTIRRQGVAAAAVGLADETLGPIVALAIGR